MNNSKMTRATYYISEILVEKINQKAEEEKCSSSHLVREILSVFFVSPEGQQVQNLASTNELLLKQEIIQLLKIAISVETI